MAETAVKGKAEPRCWESLCREAQCHFLMLPAGKIWKPTSLHEMSLTDPVNGGRRLGKDSH